MITLLTVITICQVNLFPATEAKQDFLRFPVPPKVCKTISIKHIETFNRITLSEEISGNRFMAVLGGSLEYPPSMYLGSVSLESVKDGILNPILNFIPPAIIERCR